MKKEKRIVSLSLAMPAFVFLFNPSISVIDFLPDLFGYLLLCAALRALSDLNETVGRARELFMKMVLVDAAKLALLVVTFALSSGKSQEMMLLLVFFSAGIVELYILIPAYKALFSGLLTLGYKYDNTSVIVGPAPSSKNYTDRASSYTFFFLIFKFVISILPELPILTTHSYDDSKNYSHIYEYMGLLRGFAVVICLVVGAIWLVKMIGYFSRVNKDKPFMVSLEREYRENVIPRDSLFIRRAIRGAFVLICVSALLCFDARLDGRNVLPDVLSAALLALGFLTMKKYLPRVKKYLLCATVYGVAALASDVCEANFLGNHYFGAIIRSEEAYFSYLTMAAGAVIEAVGFAFAVYALICFFKDIISNYTGFVPTGGDKHAMERLEALHIELKKKLHFVIAGAFLCGAGDVFYPIGGRYVEFAGLISAVCSLLFLAILVYTVFDITDEINAKYMLE